MPMLRVFVASLDRRTDRSLAISHFPLRAGKVWAMVCRDGDRHECSCNCLHGTGPDGAVLARGQAITALDWAAAVQVGTPGDLCIFLRQDSLRERSYLSMRASSQCTHAPPALIRPLTAPINL